MSRTALLPVLLPVLLAACDGPQSALVPLGSEAGRVGTLFWAMTIGAALILLLVVALAALALRGGPRLRETLAGERMVTGLGVVFPTVVLTFLLAWGLAVMAKGGESPPDPTAPRIEVRGEQWWWRVAYLMPDGTRIESANEVRLPVGARVALDLTSADVIHSFWAPSLAGKLDMIPGRENTLTLEATEPAASRGQCAEYCGGAHALMSFWVVAEPRAEFDAWLAREAAPALPPASPVAEAGALVFAASGCGACHAVRGTEAMGTIGPDLTHVGSRRSIAAGVLPNTAADFARWVERTHDVKPEVHMPAYPVLAPDELSALGLYLDGLE